MDESQIHKMIEKLCERIEYLEAGLAEVKTDTHRAFRRLEGLPQSDEDNWENWDPDTDDRNGK